ncbi:MAG TPA: hypothetical protein DCY76_04290 [Flavobacteriales bacterium]|nr:hypothetical protein [Flavobacteriales bacterium]
MEIEGRAEAHQQRGYALMDSIEAHGPPSSVRLIHKYKSERGGVEPAAVATAFLGLFFMLGPLPVFLPLTQDILAGRGEVANLPLLVFGYVAFGGASIFGFFVAKEPIAHIWRPPRKEELEVRIWFDSKHRFLARILHPTDKKTGQHRYPELDDVCVVSSSNTTAVETGSVYQGEHAWSHVVVRNDGAHFVIHHYIWDEEAVDLAKTVGRRIGVSFTP